ncbi:hypothetical protein HDU87_007220 [Geranomyces variabilis]|uniref:Uncharacterized protein n=1 Tax=Geranomyces variabilis TaxID=109894 RepID=A0AAD5TE90_9FUNG|nr:hypothetical protein HDU87_007220 [Geranomyces variabilis]
MSVSRLLLHVFARPSGARSLAWQVVLSTLDLQPPAPATSHRRKRQSTSFSQFESRGGRREARRCFASFVPSSTAGKQAGAAGGNSVLAPARPPFARGADSLGLVADKTGNGNSAPGFTLETWQTHLRTIPIHALPSSIARATWSYYETQIRTNSDLVSKLDRDDWFLLLVILSHDKALQYTPYMENATQLLSDMEQAGCLPDGRMFEQWARHYDLKDLKEAEAFLRMVWWCASPAIVSDALYATLINLMRKRKNLQAAAALCEQAKKAGRAGPKTYMSMARAFCSMGLAEEAIQLCEEDFADALDDNLCSQLLRKCGYDKPNIAEATKILEWAKRRNIADVRTYGAMVTALCAVGDLANVERLLADPTSRRNAADATTCVPVTASMCNDLLWAYVQKGDSGAADRLLKWMEATGVALDAVTIEARMVDLACRGDVDGAFDLFNRMQELSPEAKPTVWTYNIVINALFKNKRVDDGFEVLRRMRAAQIEPDVVTYGTLMSGFNANDRASDSLNVLSTLVGKGMVPDASTGVSALMSYASLGRVDEGLACLRWLLSEGCETSIRHWTVLINGYLALGSRQQALDLFAELLVRYPPGDVVSYTAFLHAYSKQGDITALLATLRQMQEAGIPADRVAYHQIVAAHVRTGRLSRTTETVSHMVADGIPPNLVTYTLLIQAFSREGDFGTCDRLLDEMDALSHWPNAKTLTTLVKQALKHRDPHCAVQFFERVMRSAALAHASSISPSSTTGAETPKPVITFNDRPASVLLDQLIKLGEIDFALRTIRAATANTAAVVVRIRLVSLANVVHALCRAGRADRAEDVYRLLVACAAADADLAANTPELVAKAKARKDVFELVGSKKGPAELERLKERERTGWKGIAQPTF